MLLIVISQVKCKHFTILNTFFTLASEFLVATFKRKEFIRRPG